MPGAASAYIARLRIAESPQIFGRKIDPSHPRVFADVAQDVRHLHGAPERRAVRQRAVFVAEHRCRHESYGRRDEIAVVEQIVVGLVAANGDVAACPEQQVECGFDRDREARGGIGERNQDRMLRPSRIRGEKLVAPGFDRRHTLIGACRSVDDVVGGSAERIDRPYRAPLFRREKERGEVKRLGMRFGKIATEPVTRLELRNVIEDCRRRKRQRLR